MANGDFNYKSNLEALKRRPDIAAFAMGGEDARVHLRETESGIPTLVAEREDGAFALHHPGDPVGHERGLLKGVSALASAHNVFVLGLGLGYLPLMILEQRPDIRHLAVFEPSRTVFRAALRTADLRRLFGHPGFVLVAGGPPRAVYEALAPKVVEWMANPPLLIEAPPARAFPLWTADARGQIEAVMRFGQSGLATKMRDAPLAASNLLRNLEAIEAAEGISGMDGAFAGRPAVVAAAGPSLSKNIRQLAKAPPDCVVLAADTAHEPLLAAGAVPHFVATVDPTELNLRHFPRARYETGSVLLFDPEARPELPERFGRTMGYMTNKHDCFAWMDERLGGMGTVSKGGMVSQAALAAAAYWGCDPIILVGQDLALDPASGASHAEGAALRRMARLDPSDRGHADIPHAVEEGRYSRERIHWVEGVDGTPVPATHNLVVYLGMLESDIARCSSRVIDATEGGARIRGAEIMPLREALAIGGGGTDVWRILKETRRQGARPRGRLRTEMRALMKECLAFAQRAGAELEGKTGARDLLGFLEECRHRVLGHPVTEYLVESAAPRDLFGYLTLPPANAPAAERHRHLRRQIGCILTAAERAGELCRKWL